MLNCWNTVREKYMIVAMGKLSRREFRPLSLSSELHGQPYSLGFCPLHEQIFWGKEHVVPSLRHWHKAVPRDRVEGIFMTVLL